MSDTESDDDTLCRFGTALTPYEKSILGVKWVLNKYLTKYYSR